MSAKKLSWVSAPEDIHVEAADPAADKSAAVDSHVDMTELMGSEIYLYLKANGQKLVARFLLMSMSERKMIFVWDLMQRKSMFLIKKQKKLSVSKAKGSRTCLVWLPCEKNDGWEKRK